MKLPAKYAYLQQTPLPPVAVRIALELLGTLETPGTPDNPKIIGWADEVAKLCASPYNNWAADWYNDDSVPWCGLFMAVCQARASQGRPDRFPPSKYLSALAWANFGDAVQFKGKEGYRLEQVLVGDVAVFVRQGGGHVAHIIGVSSDGEQILCVGGNQGDKVSIAAFPLSRLYAVRRPKYQVKPEGARHVRVRPDGSFSTTEQ